MEELDVGGLILGVIPEAEYQQGTAELKPGDLLLMYTDGVSEAMNRAEEEFGETRLANYIEKRRDLPCEEILAGLEEEVMRFCEFEPLMDDFTLLIARVV